MKEYLSETIGTITFGGIALLFIILLTDIVGGKVYCHTFSWLLISNFILLFIGYFGRIIIDKWKTKKKAINRGN